ncbi:hypothetical protein [Egbenema bharatensis]|uniref:hypothetical protein n=1 Tax=Egbenema bharatensis TaxID=3463334 RepID=UPI003A8B4EF7
MSPELRNERLGKQDLPHNSLLAGKMPALRAWTGQARCPPHKRTVSPHPPLPTPHFPLPTPHSLLLTPHSSLLTL